MADAIRTQVDGLNEQYSYMTALDCSVEPDMTRQEFKEETDVNNILARYGIDGIRRQAEYSEVDYNADLQQSLESIREATQAVNKLPPELQRKYGAWNTLLDGAFNGEFKSDLAEYYAAKAESEKELAAKATVDKAARVSKLKATQTGDAHASTISNTSVRDDKGTEKERSKGRR